MFCRTPPGGRRSFLGLSNLDWDQGGSAPPHLGWACSSGEIPSLVAETAATCAWHQKQTILFRVEEEVFFLGSFLYRKTSSQKPLGETFLYVSWARTDDLHMPAYLFIWVKYTKHRAHHVTCFQCHEMLTHCGTAISTIPLQNSSSCKTETVPIEYRLPLPRLAAVRGHPYCTFCLRVGFF